MNGYTGGIVFVNFFNSALSFLFEYVFFDVTSIFSNLVAIKQMDAIEANTEKTKQEAKSLELDNRAKESTQNAWKESSGQGYFVDDNGNRLNDSELDEYVKKHNSLPDFVKTSGVYSEDAARVPSAMANFRAQIAQSGMFEAQSNLAKKVAELKLADTDVMRALYRMDLEQYNQLMAAVAKTKSDIDVNATIKSLNDAKSAEAKQAVLESVARTALYGTQKSQIENSSINNLIDQIGGDKSFTDNLVTVGKILISILSGVAPNISISKVLK